MINLAMQQVQREDNCGDSICKYDLKSQLAFEDCGGADSHESICRAIANARLSEGISSRQSQEIRRQWYVEVVQNKRKFSSEAVNGEPRTGLKRFWHEGVAGP